MNSRVDEANALRDYLLGRMNEGAAVILEERYFLEDESFDRLNGALEDLTDSYERGELSQDDRQRFERRYLQGQEGLSRLRFARALRQARMASAVARRPAPFFRSVLTLTTEQAAPFRLALAAAVLIVIAGPTMYITNAAQLTRSLRAALDEGRGALEAAAAEVTRERAQRQALETQLAGLSTASFTLLPGIPRSESPALLLPRHASYARLQFALESEPNAPVFVAILSSDGSTVWSGQVQDSAGSGGATVTLPASLLPAGVYGAEVSARTAAGRREELAAYAFRVAWR